jgi:phosphoadenosine phosphosulfate reductase
MKPVELKANGLYKVAPLLRWNTRRIFEYMQEHNLPQHPLWEKGYQSIGCEPCTAVPGDPHDPRSGRWSGKNKTECGIHTFLDKKS